jgi:predicted nucleic acid-binding protein
MHVFIDTNIFETDPFWKNSFAKTLLERAKDKKLTIYISRIVYQELRIHTLRNYKKTHKILEASLIEHNRYRPINIEPIKKIEIDKEFEKFYTNLQNGFNTKILEYKTISFEKVMDRVLKREKPFNDEKKEVKDCGIWLTYAEYVEKEKISNCYFLTNNSKDFYNKEPLTSDPTEYSIHDELKRDTNEFRCFPSIRDFFRIILEPQVKATQKFQLWLDSTTIDEHYVFDILRKEAADKVESRVYSLVDKLEVDKIFNENEWFISGYCQINEIEWYDCEQVDLDILEDSCIVSAILRLRVSIEGNAYSPSHDDGDDKYQYLGERDLQINVYVSFTLSEGGELNSVDIDDIEVTSY